MNSFKYILFDLDGTLIDSGAGIIKGVKYALQKYGIKEENEVLLKTFIGPPLNRQFTKCERKAPKFIYGDISSLKTMIRYHCFLLYYIFNSYIILL